jgi:aminoglycoside phosphotransferase (APT) family kinase protein
MSDLPELTPVRDTHRFDEQRLAGYLMDRLNLDFSEMHVLQFEGGQSNPTFHIEAHGRRYVLRKKPPGELLKSAHQIDREYRVMTALKDTPVPVPPTVLLCEDDSVIGTAFYLMDHVEGRVVTDPRLPNFAPADRRLLYTDFVRVLAAIHAVDLHQVGLSDFGRPGNYYERQISRWSKQYQASETEPIDAMNNLMAWLPSHIPAGDETCLVHGDYRIGNCIVHPTEPRIVAVLDWELSTTGHPLADLGYACMMYHDVEESAFDWRAANLPTEQELVDLYCRKAGRPPVDNWTFYVVYNLFRLAAIVQGVYKRGLDGNASSEQWRERGAHAKALSARGWQLVENWENE